MDDLEYIDTVLMPEFLAYFAACNAEYPKERPLGAKAEWHGLHRKVGKLKAPLWEDRPWTGRESVRTMLLEIVGHAFLAIASLDEEHSPETTMEAPPEQPDLAEVLRRRMSAQRVMVVMPFDGAFPPDDCTHGADCPLHPHVQAPHNFDNHPVIAIVDEYQRGILRRKRAEQAGYAQMDNPEFMGERRKYADPSQG